MGTLQDNGRQYIVKDSDVKHSSCTGDILYMQPVVKDPTDTGSKRVLPVKLLTACLNSLFILILADIAKSAILFFVPIDLSLQIKMNCSSQTATLLAVVGLYGIFITAFWIDGAVNCATYGMRACGLIYMSGDRRPGFMRALARVITGHLCLPLLAIDFYRIGLQHSDRTIADSICRTRLQIQSKKNQCTEE